ncbi:MAG: hypothetical protein FWD23_17800 [Oscillospiraceae bacterium]|nr:hypothetical protein [Oscillospiraceae bacterium]
MADEKKLSLYQQQKAVKPLIEDLIPEHIDGDMKENALEFVAWLRANKMKPAWTLTNQWKAVCRGRNICRIGLCSGHSAEKGRKWVVTAYLEHLQGYEGTVIDENLQRFLWENVFYCVQKPKDSPPAEEFRNYALTYPCNLWGCAPGKTITVCGKELTNICRNGNRQYFWFHDPDDAAVGAIKRLLELEQKARVK